MKSKPLLLLLVSMFVYSCETPNSINYFNLESPGEKAVVFAESIISKKDIREGNGVFSPDGSFFFFIQVDTLSGLQIYQVDFEEGEWSDPQIASFSNQAENWEPFISQDGQSVYFVSNRSTNEKWNGRIWRTTKTDEGWSEPIMIPIPVETGIWFPSVSKDGLIYFGGSLSDDANRGLSDLYVYDPKSGSVTNIQELNTEHEEWDPFIAPDGSYMIFASDREGGYGAVDNYISFKTQNGWGPAINMGDGINSEIYDVAAKVTPDGKFILFDRPRPDDQDIYWISASMIEELRPSK